MSDQQPTSAAAQDRKNYLAKSKTPLPQLLQMAVNKSGRSAFELSREISRFAKSNRKITATEYVRWRLYDTEVFTQEQRDAFISATAHWPIAHKCCDAKWNAASEDKVICDTILRAADVPVPHSIGIFDTSNRNYPGLKKVSDANDLKEMILAHGARDIFGKVIGGMAGFGAFQVIDADETHITIKGAKPATYQDFIRDHIGDNVYLLQSKLETHPDLAPYCTSVATVRMVNLVRSSGVVVPFAVIKIPQGDNIADSFWRDGNLACAIDVETGKVQTVVRDEGVEVSFLDDHPAVPGLMGMTLPHWDELLRINDLAARTFAPLRYGSTDIAITPDGPVVVELNYGGAFELPQNATGRGFLTPEVLDFFAECGVDLNQNAPAQPKKKFSFFGKKP